MILAIFWLLIAGALFVWKWRGPDNPALNLRGTGISLGWLALVLALYNVARWWSRRSAVTQDRTLWQARRDRHNSPANRDPGPTPPDPQFDFTEQTPPREEKRSD
jgi:hypothetical protein